MSEDLGYAAHQAKIQEVISNTLAGINQAKLAPGNGQPLLPKTTLPTDAKARKAVPIESGVLRYFPDAIAAIAAVSYAGSQQHNPGKPLFWDRPKSGDHGDCLMRHFMERGTIDTDGMPHSAKVAWRALAILQLEIEASKV